MNYWLFKSEPAGLVMGRPNESRHCRVGRDPKPSGQQQYESYEERRQGLLYHSVYQKQIVGIVEVVKEHYPDHTDTSGRFGMVDVKALRPVKTPVSLSEIKTVPQLADLALIKQSRLSIVPVGKTEWKLLCRMAGLEP